MTEIEPIVNRPGLSLVSTEMLETARKLVKERVSLSYVQRKMQISYNQTERLFEIMEKEGTISKMTPSGVREYLK
jgi:DNA segregation ATPase FtsK/SpoIIIE-like protein